MFDEYADRVLTSGLQRAMLTLPHPLHPMAQTTAAALASHAGRAFYIDDGAEQGITSSIRSCALIEQCITLKQRNIAHLRQLRQAGFQVITGIAPQHT